MEIVISGNSTNFDADQRTNKVLCKKLRHSKELLGCLKSCIRSKKLPRRFVGKFDPPFFDLTTSYSYRKRAFRDGTFAKFLRLDTMNRWNFPRRGSSFSKMEFNTKKVCWIWKNYRISSCGSRALWMILSNFY